MIFKFPDFIYLKKEINESIVKCTLLRSKNSIFFNLVLLNSIGFKKSFPESDIFLNPPQYNKSDSNTFVISILQLQNDNDLKHFVCKAHSEHISSFI